MKSSDIHIKFLLKLRFLLLLSFGALALLESCNSDDVKGNLYTFQGIYKFKTAGTHFLGVKGLSAGEFMFDYMEFVPTSALEAEDIY